MKNLYDFTIFLCVTFSARKILRPYTVESLPGPGTAQRFIPVPTLNAAIDSGVHNAQQAVHSAPSGPGATVRGSMFAGHTTDPLTLMPAAGQEGAYSSVACEVVDGCGAGQGKLLLASSIQGPFAASFQYIVSNPARSVELPTA